MKEIVSEHELAETFATAVNTTKVAELEMKLARCNEEIASMRLIASRQFKENAKLKGELEDESEPEVEPKPKVEETTAAGVDAANAEAENEMKMRLQKMEALMDEVVSVLALCRYTKKTTGITGRNIRTLDVSVPGRAEPVLRAETFASTLVDASPGFNEGITRLKVLAHGLPPPAARAPTACPSTAWAALPTRALPRSSRPCAENLHIMIAQLTK